jgi:nucleoside-diphosphate-sugar epimerase
LPTIIRKRTTDTKAALDALRGTNVLVVGGLGFIGSNLSIQLVRLGARVTIIDNKYESGGANDFNIEAVRNQVELIVSDIAKCDRLASIVSDCAYVFDLAAQVSHVDSMAYPALDLEMNCLSHLPLLEACRKAASDLKLIYTGSRVQYGRITKIPVQEDHPIVPVDTNGISKHAYEQYCLLYHRSYGLRTTSLRLTNTYGPRNVMKHSKQGFVNWFVRLCIDKVPIEVYGRGRQLRDFTYVDDVVSACLLAAICRTEGHALNVGGYSTSVRGIAEILKEIRPHTEIVIRPFPAERKAVEIGDYVADYSRFSELTGWTPTTPLKPGLVQTVAYYEECKSHYW